MACLRGHLKWVNVAFDAILDDPNNPHERVLRISNGLSPWDPGYEVVVLQIRLKPDGHLLLDILECTDGVTFDVPKKHQKLRSSPSVWIVRDDKNGLAWVEAEGVGVSPICGFDQIPTIAQTVAETARFFGHQLEWQDERHLD